MEQKLYAKIFKWCSWALLIASVIILIIAWMGGFKDSGVNLLLYWAYIMVGVTIAAVVLVGLYISATTNPKSLIKTGIVIVGAAVLCLLAYLLAKGNPAMGLTTEQPSVGTLKLTDTVLNLTYILGVAAIVAIVFGEIFSSIRSKKA
ncbi:MAG: hypothetical protein IJM35_00490 [Bacteroidales bacterium]|jgi:hypothetical protein|nr:hypothetical protein [Bacteroidales bacterium]